MKTGYIYRLWTPGITDEYIGSTTDMRKAKWKHKSFCNNEKDRQYNYRVYQFIRSHGGWDNWRMDMIEQIEFEDRMELRKRDGEIIQSRGSTLNVQILGRSQLECKIAYNESNKEKFECLCGGRYIKVHKLQHFKTNKHIKNYEHGLYNYINS